MKARALRPAVLVGLDIHPDQHTAAIATYTHLAAGANWREIPTLTVHNTKADYAKLMAQITAAGRDSPIPPTTLVAIDRTGTHYSAAIAGHLRAAGATITWIDPQQIKNARDRWAQGDKTDGIDAQIFAFDLYLRLAHGDPILIDNTDPDLEARATEIRTLLSLAKQAEREHTRYTNRLRGLCVRAWPEVAEAYFGWWANYALAVPTARYLPQAENLLPRTTLRRLKALADTVGDTSDPIAEAIQITAASRSDVEARLEDTQRRLNASVAAHPYTPTLTQFPKIALGHAAAIIATVTDVARYETPKAFRKACGFSGVRAWTGKKKKNTKAITKPRAKSALFLSVLNQLKEEQPTPYTALYRRMRKKGKHHYQAAYAAAAKTAEHIYHALRDGAHKGP